MTSIDAGHFYDVAFHLAETLSPLVAPDLGPTIKGAGTLVNALLGVDVRNDLLGSLGDQFVSYTAPSEGPLTLGQVVLFKVKNEEKLKESLVELVKAISRLSGADIILKKRTYQGVELREVRVKQQGFFFMPCYAIHKGWLCVGFFPQPVQGFITRSNGGMAAWKPSPHVKTLFDALPREAVSFTYSDPRPSLLQLLSLAPTIGGLVTTFNPETTFELGSIPNAQEATRHLFPNVSAATASEKSFRLESRASLPLPFDLAGIDVYAMLFLFGRFAAF